MASEEQTIDKEDEKPSSGSTNQQTPPHSSTLSDELFPVRVFISSTSINHEIKQNQRRSLFVLESKKIPFEQVDVALSKAKARMMRATVGDPSANPPRFFKGEVYLGGYKEFSEAVDDDNLEEFLHLKSAMEGGSSHGQSATQGENPKTRTQLKRKLDNSLKQ